MSAISPNLDGPWISTPPTAAPYDRVFPDRSAVRDLRIDKKFPFLVDLLRYTLNLALVLARFCTVPSFFIAFLTLVRSCQLPLQELLVPLCTSFVNFCHLASFSAASDDRLV